MCGTWVLLHLFAYLFFIARWWYHFGVESYNSEKPDTLSFLHLGFARIFKFIYTVFKSLTVFRTGVALPMFLSCYTFLYVML